MPSFPNAEHARSLAQPSLRASRLPSSSSVYLHRFFPLFLCLWFVAFVGFMVVTCRRSHTLAYPPLVYTLFLLLYKSSNQYLSRALRRILDLRRKSTRIPLCRSRHTHAVFLGKSCKIRVLSVRICSQLYLLIIFSWFYDFYVMMSYLTLTTFPPWPLE